MSGVRTTVATYSPYGRAAAGLRCGLPLKSFASASGQVASFKPSLDGGLAAVLLFESRLPFPRDGSAAQAPCSDFELRSNYAPPKVCGRGLQRSAKVEMGVLNSTCIRVHA